MPGDARELAEELCEHCRNVAGEEVRSVVHYDSNDHVSLYTREDVQQELQMDVATRTMFRTPLVQVSRTIWKVSRLAPTLSDPDFATFSFGDTLLLLFPIDDSEGIVVSLDSDGTHPEELVLDCKGMVRDWVDTSF